MASANIAPAHEPLLVLHQGSDRKAVPLAHLPFTIGRSADRDLVLNDPRVSRAHASIHQMLDGSYELHDENSRFGTSVNREPIKTRILEHGDSIQFGGAGSQVVFRLHSDESPSRDWLSSSSAIRGSSELEQLNLFLQAARSLNTTSVLNDVLRILLDYTLKIIGAERGYVFLKQPGGELSLAQARDLDGNDIAEATGISRSVLEQCASSSVEFLIGDTARDEDLAERNSIIALDLRTVVSIPLRRMSFASNATPNEDGSNPILGVLYLDSHFATHNLSGCSPEILRAIATEAARVVENARLVQAEQEARQYQQELAIASAIQQRLSSSSLPRTPYMNVNARTVPCKEVGGDVYDVVLTPSGVAIVLADVSGKGISAAILASMIQGMLYAELSAGMPLISAVATLNRFLCERVGGQKYATLLVAEVHPSGDMEMVCCGHLAPMLVRGGQIIRLLDGCMPVGLFETAQFVSSQARLEAGDSLLFFTDGITEAENDLSEEFGEHRLQNCTSAANVMEATFTSLRDFLGTRAIQDDCSLVEVCYKGQSGQQSRLSN
ncbi:MAG: SpoIIE family protein phosphatase [Acidobacteriaceae bacterium]